MKHNKYNTQVQNILLTQTEMADGLPPAPTVREESELYNTEPLKKIMLAIKIYSIHQGKVVI